MTKILDTLVKIKAINLNDVVLVSEKTRDLATNVFRDEVTGVIFLEDYYVGDNTYKDGKYREELQLPHLEDVYNSERRSTELAQFFIGKVILDIGYGRGTFLLKTYSLTKEAYGFEIDNNSNYKFKKTSINLLDNLDSLDAYFDSIFLFHILEHIPDPLDLLDKCKRLLKVDGSLIIEIPHAGDFILSKLAYNEYTDYILWSQHLVLHTRDSITKLLKYAGFSNIIIKGVQRYPISNHYWWLAKNKPGGHKQNISLIDNPSLHGEFQNALASIDATDSLLIIAKKEF